MAGSVHKGCGIWTFTINTPRVIFLTIVFMYVARAVHIQFLITGAKAAFALGNPGVTADIL